MRRHRSNHHDKKQLISTGNRRQGRGSPWSLRYCPGRGPFPGDTRRQASETGVLLRLPAIAVELGEGDAEGLRF
jgi:hypothetical protein